MVNVSKQKLNENLKEELFTQLADVFLASDSRKESSRALTEVLSTTEKVMIAKRVGIIAMVMHKFSSYEISQALNVSTATASRVEHRYENGKYPHIRKVLQRRKAVKNVFSVVNDILCALSPSRASYTARKQIVRDMEKIRAGSR